MFTKIYHLLPTVQQWKHMLDQDDLKNLRSSSKIRNAKIQPQGVLIKVNARNNNVLKDAYRQSKLVGGHFNAIEYICYFEYKKDIVQLLTGYAQEDDTNAENSIIIMPAYSQWFNITGNVLKQIILFLYDVLFSENISFKHISYDMIYLDRIEKPKKLKYIIGGQKYIVQTTNVIKIDVGACGIEQNIFISPLHYRRLYENICSIMPTDVLKEYVTSFMNHNDDSRIVHPLKILGCLLFTVMTETSKPEEAAQCHFPNRCCISQCSQNVHHFQSDAAASP
jgi:hypothetical protein